MGLLRTYRFFASHPLTRNHKFTALIRWLKWQIGSRVVPGSVAVPFVNNTRLLVKPGMTGATGNIYAGLHEFEDMGFVLHFLRESDLFVDIGANIGSYTILATVTGAEVVSFEPVAQSYDALLDNIHLNRVEAKVDARNQAVGRCEGEIMMTADQDTTNQALSDNEDYQGKVARVSVISLDEALDGRVPKLIKIDVEGFESEVLAGANKTLSNPSLQAVIMELNGSGERYDFDENDLHGQMLELGFYSCSYDPINRELTEMNGERVARSNALYLRNPVEVQSELARAPKYLTLMVEV